MNWEIFSEKLSRDGKTVFIFCDKDDRDNLFIKSKTERYHKNGYKVVIRKGKKRNEEDS